MRSYYGHPPACTCADCTNKRSGTQFAGNDWYQVNCPNCGGTGKTHSGCSRPNPGGVGRCLKCFGTGKISQWRSTSRSASQPSSTEQHGRPTDYVVGEGAGAEPPCAPAPDSQPKNGITWGRALLIIVIIFGLFALMMFAGKLPSEDESDPVPSQAIARATVAPTSERQIMILQRQLEHKQDMLKLINAERQRAGLNPVVLGDNIAAQLHAELSVANCSYGHWGKDGLQPYMRYTLAAGYQWNVEVVHSTTASFTVNGSPWSGIDYCLTRDSMGVPPSGSALSRLVGKAITGWMSSPGHRQSILMTALKKVNIGLATDGYNSVAVAQFEGDYVEYVRLPSIERGVLTLSGKLRHGAIFGDLIDRVVQIYYDPPPQSLTRGQLARTSCYDTGLHVGSLRQPMTGLFGWKEDEFTMNIQRCPDPYIVSASAPAPQTLDEDKALVMENEKLRRMLPTYSITVPWITASKWQIDGDNFTFEADLGSLQKGVYTILLWALISGEPTPVSQYSIFHGITPPDTYTP